MALQKSVQLYPAIGSAGQAVVAGQSVYTPFNYLSDGTAKAGSFAFLSSSSTNTGGVAQKFAGLTTTTATAVLGFVERVSDGYLSVSEDASLVYKEGLALKVAIQGDYYVVATSSASVGDHVLVNKTTGAISFATPTAPSAALHSGTVTDGVVANLTVDLNSGVTVPSGSVDTGWIVKTAATASGDIIIISNHSAD